MIADFERGFRFGCTACGQCCARLSADLPLSHADVIRISAHLGVSIRSFVATYCTYVIDVIEAADGRTARMPWIGLRVPKSGRCVFLEASNRCSIHAVKPFVCSRSPFAAYVAGGEGGVWQQARSYCPGIGEGERYSRARIRSLLEEERAMEQEDFDRVAAHSGSLARALGSRLPRPVVRRVKLAADGTIASIRTRGTRGG